MYEPALQPALPLSMLCAFTLSACPASPPDTVSDLVEQTLDNMVYVKGSSFMMGDIGYGNHPFLKWIFRTTLIQRGNPLVYCVS